MQRFSTIDVAEKLFEAGFTPIPLQPKTKKPKGIDGRGTKWQTVEYKTIEELREDFSEESGVGLKLDRTTAVLDLDAVNIANDYGATIAHMCGVPTGHNIIGRPLKPNGAIILKTDTDSQYYEVKDHSGRKLVEILVKGKQKVLPPSLYEENGVIQQFKFTNSFEAPFNYCPFNTLKDAAILVSIFSLLDAAYPAEGSRDEACRNTAYVLGQAPFIKRRPHLNAEFATGFIQLLVRKNEDTERRGKQWHEQFERQGTKEEPFSVDNPAGLLLKHFPDLHHKDAEIIAKLLEYKKKEETEEAEPEEDIEISISPLSELTEADTKPREWLIKGLCQRGVYSQIQGSGGAGKSIFAMTVGIMATNKKSYLCDLFSFQEDCKVLIINNEDPQEELDRRALAIMKCLNANFMGEEKLEYNLDNVYVKSYLNKPIKLLDKSNNKLHLRPKSIEAIQKFIEEKAIDIVIFDPLISFHNAEENLNKDMDMFIREAIIAPFASKQNVGVIGVHHVAKGTSNNDTDIEGNTNASRGASAITNAARSVFRLAGMNLQTAKDIWTDYKKNREVLEQRHDYVQIAFGKVNNTKATEGNWLYKHPVDFRNKNGELIDGICLRRDYSIESKVQDAAKRQKKEDDKERLEIIQTLEKANIIDVGEEEGVWELMDIARHVEEHNEPYIKRISQKETTGKTPRQMKNKGSQRDGEDYRKTDKAIANHIQTLFVSPYTYQDKVFQYENKKIVSGNKRRWFTMKTKSPDIPADVEASLMKSMEEDAQLS